MEDNKIIKFVYSLFLGILLAIFVGVGVNTFYPGPEWPEYPSELNYGYDGTGPTEEQKAKQREYDESIKAFNEKQEDYTRNLSVVLLVAAVLLLVLSVILEKKLRFITDGIMLGGLFTIIYSLSASIASGDDYVRFIATSIGVVVVLAVGYIRFIKEPKQKTTKKTTKKKK